MAIPLGNIPGVNVALEIKDRENASPSAVADTLQGKKVNSLKTGQEYDRCGGSCLGD